MQVDKDKRPAILLCGETSGLLKVINQIFVMEGYNVCMGTDKYTILSLLETQSPDVVILDIVLFSNNILQTIEMIRQQSSVPVIIITGQSETDTQRNISFRKSDGFLSKPFRMHELLELVDAKIKNLP
ncbi:MAG: response regulator [Dehalococcoidales bacterium]|nr:response regulator [Dehalococcoidales bacterium]